MKINLFEHNKEAYISAVRMLNKKGKAAIIHPTGTGKSFIGFKLCEDNPLKIICWLSPSEYIFKTQLENLAKASESYIPENIRFFTYAKLLNMSKPEMEKINPDYIILDEFHRCGAEQWGAGVNALLDIYRDKPILGLSATAIRYLDNQRNMSDELFDGNIASEITLGEAIVRGILNPPKYVLSFYSYKNEIDKYQKKVAAAKNKAIQDKGERYLEALRRALKKADGLKEIFEKHITDKSGKYIVFCSNIDHMHEMVELSNEWFSKIDESPHIYTAYSYDPETSESFKSFKSDNSNHLKLLFCIDMLNEGIHVENIDGVILLRPTVSPIIYKQQIGRALSAGKKKNSVIFDIVMNIENLYSIGAVEEEMQIATTYYRMHGKEEQIINEHFKVIDEVQDCLTLFRKLNETLGATWEIMYANAEEYYREHGDLEVPKRYVCADGTALGSWLQTQRAVYAGNINGILTPDQIARLNRIGMRWTNTKDISWQRYYSAAKNYYQENGNLFVPNNDKTYNGIKLGRWISRLRIYKQNNIRSVYLTKQRIAELDKIGMIWDAPNYLWEQSYHSALQFYEQHGHINVPTKYVDENGIRLGAWIASIRRQGKSSLAQEQIDKLCRLNMEWTTKRKTTWIESFNAAKRYKIQFGDLNIPHNYISPEGYELGKWLNNQKRAFLSTMNEQRKNQLKSIGFSPAIKDTWDEKMRLVEDFYKLNKNTKIPANYVVNGVWLGKWLQIQISRLNNRSTCNHRNQVVLSEEQIQRLNAIGIQKGVSQKDVAWDQQYEEARKFYVKNGHLKIPKRYCSENGKHLGAWIINQRTYYRNGTLSKVRIEKLNHIGMIWVCNKIRE